MKKNKDAELRNNNRSSRNYTLPTTQKMYKQGTVEIVGYGFPKLSFDSHFVTILNSPNVSEEYRQADLYKYILDPDKMTPMQGNSIIIL